MTDSTRYFKGDRIVGADFRRLLRLFAMDLPTARMVALTGLNPNTVDRYLRLFREMIANWCDLRGKLSGVVEVGESCFKAPQKSGKNGPKTVKRFLVFGMRKRGGQVRTELISGRQAAWGRILREKAGATSVIYTDDFASYCAISSLGYRTRKRVRRRQKSVHGKCRGNGIEHFWGYSKSRLARYHGVPCTVFRLHLKECEFRFNHRLMSVDELYDTMLEMCEDWRNSGQRDSP